jgi:hypothetical protein
LTIPDGFVLDFCTGEVVKAPVEVPQKALEAPDETPPPPGRPDPPLKNWPDESWEHHEIHQRVLSLLVEIPVSISMNIQGPVGVSVTGLQALGPALADDLEVQLVGELNRRRSAWDPRDKYHGFGFVRQPQNFPDILFTRLGSSEEPLFGIELKSWYLLANEEEPSFRFRTTPEACAEADILALYPWCFVDVYRGPAKLFQPYLCPARWAAEYRNYHWNHLMRHKKTGKVVSPKGVAPYPKAGARIHDRGSPDHGGNFGRMARWGLLDTFTQEANAIPLLLGIPAWAWRLFLSAADCDQETQRQALFRLRRHLHKTMKAPDEGIDRLFHVGRDAITSHLRHR